MTPITPSRIYNHLGALAELLCAESADQQDSRESHYKCDWRSQASTQMISTWFQQSQRQIPPRRLCVRNRAK